MVKKMARENRVKKTKKFTKRMKVKQMIVFCVLIIVLDRFSPSSINLKGLSAV